MDMQEPMKVMVRVVSLGPQPSMGYVRNMPWVSQIPVKYIADNKRFHQLEQD